MKQKRLYLIPQVRIVELRKEDVLSASDPFGMDAFDPLGTETIGG